MEHLDRLDRRLLYELDANSRLSVSELARAIRQGRDRVEYRIERFLEQKIIRRFTTSVNLARLGFTIYKLYLRLESNQERVTEFVSYLRKHPRVYWIAQCDGSWDLMIAVFARSPEEYYNIQQELLSAFNSIILDFAMYQLVELDLYGKQYFIAKGGNKASNVATVGGTPEQFSIDATDYKILKLLSTNARRSNVELAERTRTTTQTVKHRIRRMEEAGLITGYRIDLNLGAVGMQFFKAQLFLRSYDRKLLQEFRKYCTKRPHITYYIQQLGNCTLELELEVKDYEHYHAILDELREEFAPLVRNFQTVLVRRAYFNWVPQDLEIH